MLRISQTRSLWLYGETRLAGLNELLRLLPALCKLERVKKNRPGFDDYYAALFAERWPRLLAAMRESPRPQAFSQGLLRPYYMDTASVAAALALGPSGNAHILDMCAAPGGKTLVLASSLGPEGFLLANERSSQRRRRLRETLDAHLPEPLRSRVSVSGHNAAAWGLHEKNVYDKVLLDAPCSSERHLVRSPKYLESWSPARTRSLARQAYAMLLAALDAVKPGGLVVYSTCALCDGENDAVVERVLTRRPGAFRPVKTPLPESPAPDISLFFEETLYGRAVLPDSSDGAGPLYFALLRREQ